MTTQNHELQLNGISKGSPTAKNVFRFKKLLEIPLISLWILLRFHNILEMRPWLLYTYWLIIKWPMGSSQALGLDICCMFIIFLPHLFAVLCFISVCLYYTHYSYAEMDFHLVRKYTPVGTFDVWLYHSVYIYIYMCVHIYHSCIYTYGTNNHIASSYI